MITTFTISNFRTFRHLHLADMDRINLLAGANNVGKTAFLEALWQFTGPDQPDIGLRLNRFRSFEPIESKEFSFDLFHKYDSSKPIHLVAKGDWGRNPRSLTLEIRSRSESRTTVTKGANGIEPDLLDETSPHEIALEYKDETGATYKSTGHIEASRVDSNTIRVHLRSQQESVPGRPGNVLFGPHARGTAKGDSERFGRLELEGDEKQIVKALQTFEPSLNRLTIIPVDDVPMIHADVGIGRLIPVKLLGDGMQRVLSLALAFQGASGGLMLVDEFENGIHHSKLKDLWHVISSFSERYDTQVVATTHSLECTRAAHQVFSEANKYDFRFFRLDRIDGEIKVKALGKTMLDTAFQANLEVR